MNSPETPVYSKRRTLYGLNLAKKTKRPNIILCEGNLDIVTLHQAGFDNAVASMGTALTVEQTHLLSRYTKELVLCYDNDAAGQTATERALQLLNNSEFAVRVLQLPRRRTESGELVKQDADDFIKNQGPAAFEQLLSGSGNGVEFRLTQIAGKYDLQDDQARVAFCGEASELLAELSSPVERDIYARRAAGMARIDEAAMALEVERSRKRLAGRARKTQLRRDLNPALDIQPRERELRYENVASARAEEGVLRLLLLDDALFPAEAPLQAEEFSYPLYGKAFFLLWELHAAGRPVSLTALTGALDPGEMSLLTRVLQAPEVSDNRERALRDYIDKIREEHGRHDAAGDRLAALTARYRKTNQGTGGKQP
jgi:DNA primase